jgi:LDH2 family malate/lactate/ureidoglycolate dehydrogenase
MNLYQPLGSSRFIGTFIIVIDPTAFGNLEVFISSTTKLDSDILVVAPIDPGQPVRVLGFRGSEQLEKNSSRRIYINRRQGMEEIRICSWRSSK